MWMGNRPGCWRCNLMGHAEFCGCDCHDEENAERARRREAWRQMDAMLGTAAVGPFDGIDVVRDDDGVITAAHAVTRDG